MTDCLTTSEIERFHEGILDAGAEARLRSHIADCPRCADRVKQEERRFANWVDRLRALELSSFDINAFEATGSPPDSASSSTNATRSGQLATDAIAGYRIIEEIHRGGQGIVYHAKQDSTKRDVAIKVLLWDSHASASAQRRFEREVELVAGMQHPNIVPVFDSGILPDGRQFCVMELVDGRRFDEYLRESNVDMTTALRLFAVLCAAVNYAHQKGVIHRDLKPSNVLIDANGNPRVLDFGLAKPIATEVDLNVSHSGQIFGTLPYLSPEQAAGNPHEVDTRSDVYSLGVVLYEMLTGQFPYPVSGGIHNTINSILDAEPVRPRKAWRAETGLRVNVRSRRAGRESCPIDDELETIVLKALEKDRDRRYQSALELGLDIERCLSGEPISAKRNSSWYLIRKGIAKHKMAVAFSAVLILMLVGWAATSSYFYTKQRRLNSDLRAERDRAVEAESQSDARSAQVREMALTLLFDIHNSIKDLPGATPVREKVISKALSYLDSLASESADDPGLQMDIAHAYLKIGDVQGGVGAGNLGDTRAAGESYDKALAIVRTLEAGNAADDGIRQQLAACMDRKAKLYLATGESAPAYELLDEARSIAAALLDRPSRDATTDQLYAAILDNIGEAQLQMGRNQKAQASFEAALDFNKRRLKRYAGDHSIRLSIVRNHQKLADVATSNWQFDRALQHYQRSLALGRELESERPNDAAVLRSVSIAAAGVAHMFLREGKVEDSIERFAIAMSLDTRLAELDPANVEAQRDLALSCHQMGDALIAKGDLDAATPYYEKALSITLRSAESNPNTTRCDEDLARAYRKLGDLHVRKVEYPKALSEFQKAVAIHRKIADRDPGDMVNRQLLAIASSRLGGILETTGKYADALDQFQAARRVINELAAAHPENFEVVRNKAGAYEQLAQFAVRQARRAAEDGRHADQVRELSRAVAMFRQCRTLFVGLINKRDASEADREIVRRLDEIIAGHEAELEGLQTKDEGM